MSHYTKDVSGFSCQKVKELVVRRPELEVTERLDVVAVLVELVELVGELTTDEFIIDPS